MDITCGWIQNAVTEFATGPRETYFSSDVLSKIRKHLKTCSPCRSLVEHDLQGASPDILVTLLHG